MKKILAIASALLILASCTKDEVSINPTSLTSKNAASSQQITVNANGPWTSSATGDFVTVSPSSGTGTMTVSISVSENAGAARQALVTFTLGEAIATLEVFQEQVEPGISNYKHTTTGDYEGIFGTIVFSTKESWTIETKEEVTFDQTSGSAGTDITVHYTTVPGKPDGESVYQIAIRTHFGGHEDLVIVPKACETLGDYDYPVAKMPNGSWWFVEPLHYVPAGYTVSEDAADNNAHIWYPYAIENSTAVVKKDDETIKKNGYLYDMFAVLNTSAIDGSNAASFEGKQGICPKGWHVPTRDDYFALGGSTVKSASETTAPEDKTAPFYDEKLSGGSIVKYNEGGWNFVASGSRIKANYTSNGAYNKTSVTADKTADAKYVGCPAMTYVASSTFNSYKEGTNCQFFALMSTFTTTLQGKLHTAYSHVENGVQVRCVKDAK